ncbi:MAG TPA: fatty acyl-AMP ligase [Candidatus Xenobia bacterium]|nr:fatty acyl-AMP ligase [Candidatus Xenobia bacterium]
MATETIPSTRPGVPPGDVSRNGAETLLEVLRARAETTPQQVHLLLYDDQERLTTLNFAELYAGASAIAQGLSARGIRRGDTVALMLPTGREFFFTFLGTLLEGAIPVPLYPPFRADRTEEYAQRQTAILRNAEARALVTFREVERLARLLKPRVSTLAVVATAEPLGAHGQRRGPSSVVQPDDVALIQYTSGSTGDPRGVVVTHRALLANLRAIGHGTQVRGDDVVVCWLPLYHDMGLIGCWLFALYYGLPMVTLSPLAFLRRPERWLWAFHRHRGTLSPAPNFAYELCVRKVSDAAIAGLDLSSWRVALNGAEPISPETLERFAARYAPHGFRPEAMMPVYGLAECTVALTFAPLGRAPQLDRVERDTFQKTKQAKPAAASGAGALRFVSVGRALPGHEIRIVDDHDQPLPERLEGHVQFRGASAMQGYYRNPEATEEAKTADGWYRTGDLGYLAGGELYITGRVKDLIIKAGRNIYPQEVEELAASVEGVRRGCVAAFAVPELRSGTESLVLVAETRETDAAVQARISAEIMRRVNASARVSPDVVRLVPPQSIPKTPSGKLRRSACRELYLRDALTLRPAPAWVQVTRLVAGNALETLRGLFTANHRAPQD